MYKGTHGAIAKSYMRKGFLNPNTVYEEMRNT